MIPPLEEPPLVVTVIRTFAMPFSRESRKIGKLGAKSSWLKQAFEDLKVFWWVMMQYHQHMIKMDRSLRYRQQTRQSRKQTRKDSEIWLCQSTLPRQQDKLLLQLWRVPRQRNILEVIYAPRICAWRHDFSQINNTDTVNNEVMRKVKIIVKRL